MTDIAKADQTRLEGIVDNAWLKLGARVIGPILLAAMTWMFNNIINKIDNVQMAQWTLTGQVSTLQSSVEEKFNHLNTKIMNNKDTNDRQDRSIGELWNNKQDKERLR